MYLSNRKKKTNYFSYLFLLRRNRNEIFSIFFQLKKEENSLFYLEEMEKRILIIIIVRKRKTK